MPRTLCRQDRFRFEPLFHILLASLTFWFATLTILSGCVSQSTSTSGEISRNSAANTAETLANKAMATSISYPNSGKIGPALVVLPGQFKNANSSFAQRVSPNNIADFGEMELDRANFKVLERNHLGPLLEEITLAANMGDQQGLTKFKKGKFATTRWFAQFDVLRAEPLAEAGTSFDGKAIGDLVTTLAGDSVGGKAAGSLIASTGGSDDTRIWIVGMRYKIMDATSSEVVKTDYLEEKMEVGSSSAKFLGISHTEKGAITIDSMVHQLIKRCVAEIDKLKGHPAASAAIAASPVVPATSSSSNRTTDASSPELEASQGKSAKTPRNDSREVFAEANPICKELRKSWQLGDPTVMQRYIQECAK